MNDLERKETSGCIIIDITERWEYEALESLFGDEPISNLRVENPCRNNEVEYELELELRRKSRK